MDGFARPLSRRAVLVSSAATAMAAPTSSPSADAVRRNDEYVASLLKRVNEEGAFVDEYGLKPPGPLSGLLEAGTASFLSPSSRYSQSAELFAKLQAAGRNLDRRQRSSGNIDLLSTNFNSPPDTGFTVHSVATSACLATRAGNTELAAITRRYLQRAGAALAVGGVHTPNHRWVVSAALAKIHELDPKPEYLRRIGQWLAEGIDIDAEGQYTERSTSIYNAVSDNAFLVLAIKLKRPDLLNPVRRNLDSMMYLIHPNYEVVTDVSLRQDRGQRGDMGRYWLPLRYLANLDGNGIYATVADAFESKTGRLSAMMEYPELLAPGPQRAPPPLDFVRDFPGLGIVRIRRGMRSATIVRENTSFFSLRNGDSVIQAVRFAAPFFGHGQFTSPKIEKTGSGWRLEQTLRNGYYQPLDPPRKVAPGEWYELRPLRKLSEVCTLRQSVDIRETAKGFVLAFQAEGTEGVPVEVEVSMRPGVRDGIHFGPLPRQHSYLHMRGAEPELPGESDYLTGITPFRHTVEFECL